MVFRHVKNLFVEVELSVLLSIPQEEEEEEEEEEGKNSLK